MSVTILVAALFAAAPLPAPVSAAPVARLGDLAAQPLAAGRKDEALAVLEKASAANPHDAAVLINLGIAHAQRGDDAKARTAFEAALACHEVVELDTAGGAVTDSRRLARKAIKMLERGEFRPASARAGQLTYRD
ncbi:MAG TPA: tetratricopeptide repeat protein [Erythrobacter sp.]|nr:tetratricopeptide repeat protein [Erythrobacter sp.]